MTFFLTFIAVYCLKKKANMDSNTINYNEEVLKGGLIVSGVSILLTMIIYIIDIELLVSGWFGFISLILSIGILIYIGRSFRDAIGGYMTYKNSLKFTYLVLLVSYVVGSIFNFLLYNVIDPSLTEVVTELTIQNTIPMLESFGTPQEAIDAAVIEIEKGVEQQSSPMGILKATPWALLFTFIFALIASFFVKKNEPVSDRIN